MKKQIIRVAVFLILLIFCSQKLVADGVTFITHGWNPNLAGAPAWLASMRNDIASGYLNDEQNFGVITVTKPAASLVVECNPWDFNLTNGNTGEIIIILDWSSIADHLISGVAAQDVATLVVDKLVAGQNGKPPVAELPIHLIGHSRGGGMVCEIARLLGEKGVVVDHLTPLDPHPLTSTDPQPVFSAPVIIDTPAAIYENVIFADVYSQLTDYPKGEYLNGGYNREWGNMPGGYFDNASPNDAYANHRNIFLMYQGTINTNNPVNNGEATMNSTERNAWFNAYETNGFATGFYYSRICNKRDRASADTPNDGDQIRKGYINDPLFGGAGERANLSWSEAVWPNIAALDILTNNVTLGHGAHIINNGDTLQFRYTGLDYDSSGTVTLVFDADHNPYNSNDFIVITNINYSASNGNYFQNTISWEMPSVTAGTYKTCAKISDGPRTRYFYSDSVIVSVPEPTLFWILDFGFLIFLALRRK